MLFEGEPVIQCACLGIFSVLEIERRPRGASRASPLLHLLQRAMACEAIVVSLGGSTRFFGWHCWRPTCLQPCAKANNHGLTGTARCNKCRSGLARDAPRGRRSISRAPHPSRHALTSPNATPTHPSPGFTTTVHVVPAASKNPSGTSSMWIRTGTRCARRTQLKVGLTSAISSRLCGLSRS